MKIDYDILEKTDPEVAAAIFGEVEREHGTLEMIASENFVSPSVLAATGSVTSRSSRYIGSSPNTSTL